ncbi:MAG: hypothetical protein F4Y91_15760 [Gemmatimonadetes bacterium]|nr:hypothetical protein [Gemmatimonadota bacterium]MXY83471.1 hypothetical protein [Gemmatimonadota bacterium]MYB71535.1 hypothetical protein [Gemmatimonadota bacterium]
MEMRFKQRWHLVILSSALILASSQLLHAQEGTDTQSKATAISHSQAIALSVAFPGLGQLTAGHRIKGTALVATGIATIVGWLTSHADYNTQANQFALEKERYISLQNGGSFDAAEKSWRRLGNLKSDLDGSHIRRRLFGVLAVGIYSYNLLDVLLLDGASPAAKRRMRIAPLPQTRTSGVLLVAQF